MEERGRKKRLVERDYEIRGEKEKEENSRAEKQRKE